MMRLMRNIERGCNFCDNVYTLRVDMEDLAQWRIGTLIQVAMPYLTADERELLISGTCGRCFDRMFEGV
jgi:hypothetical protein